MRLLKLSNPWGILSDWDGDWSDQSELWTPELRQRFSYQQGNTSNSFFFMPFEAYIEQYKRTSVAVEQVLEPLAHARVQHSFSVDKSLGSSKPAFFRFHLERDIDLSRETLTISVHQ